MAQQDGPLAVAVSGGGDSLALMHLLSAFAKAHKLKSPIVLTVDHGLRKTSGKEARQVAAWAKKAGLAAHVLSWRGAKPKSGVEAAAREARYRLMGDWLAKHKIAALYVGHTIDDQAETFLLRLARGSGLDGLAAMRARAPWPVPGFPLLSVERPLLGITRGDLRVYLTALGQAWQDDPMNEDAAFDRVKIRKARGALADLGLTPSRIAAAATHLARARAALETVTEAVLARAAGQGQGGGAARSGRAGGGAPRGWSPGPGGDVDGGIRPALSPAIRRAGAAFRQGGCGQFGQRRNLAWVSHWSRAQGAGGTRPAGAAGKPKENRRFPQNWQSWRLRRKRPACCGASSKLLTF